VSGKATIVLTSLAPNLLSSSVVSQAQSKTYGPFGVPMTVVVTAVDQGVTYDVVGDLIVNNAIVDGAGNTLLRKIPGARGTDPLDGQLLTLSPTLSAETGSTATTASNVTTAEGPGVRYQTTGVNGEWAQSQWTLPHPMTIRQLAAVLYLDSTKMSSVSLYVGTSDGFGASTSLARTHTVSNNSGANGTLTNGLPVPLLYGSTSSGAWANTGSLDLDTTLFTQMRIRIAPVAGQLVDATLVRFYANPNRKSRIAIVADDGYKSWFTYAIPLLQARGLVCSMGLIEPNIGLSSTYMSDRDLLAANANGHECITHGPTAGTGSLIDNYTTTAERIADMVAARAAIKARGLFANASQEKCYIWPQGKFQSAANESALLDAALANGFTLSRSVNRFLPWSVDLAKSTKYGAFVLPIVGHSRQTSEANEDAEIVNITNSLAYAAANGLDAILMFHHVIADQGVFATTSSIDIEVSRLKTILDAVLTHIAAGNAENVLFSDLA